MNIQEGVFIEILYWVQPLFLWYFAILNGIYSLLIIFGAIRVYLRRAEVSVENLIPILRSNSLPEITLFMPMYNEEKSALESIQSAIRLSYRYKKIVIINDGSIDSSLELLINALDLIRIPKLYEETITTQPVRNIYQSRKHPDVICIDKERGGKFDAVNAALNLADTPFFIVVDADTFIDDGEFEALIRPILSNPETIGVGASVRIKNGCSFQYNKINTELFPKTYLSSMQAVEYIRVFLTRLGWDFMNGNFIIAGAFSLFPVDLIKKIGGYTNSVGEDVEIVVRLHRAMHEAGKKYKIFYLPDPVAWTLVPEEWKRLGKQRTRWHLAITEVLFIHRKLFFNPRYRLIGMFVYPFWIFGEVLEPFVEVLGYLYILVAWWFGILHWPFLLFYLALSFGLIFLYTTASLLVEELSFKKYPSLRTYFLLFTSCVVENIGYHQIGLFWRIRGFFQVCKKIPFLERERKKIQKNIQNINEEAKES